MCQCYGLVMVVVSWGFLPGSYCRGGCLSVIRFSKWSWRVNAGSVINDPSFKVNDRIDASVSATSASIYDTLG